jgi:hypothetical protein
MQENPCAHTDRATAFRGADVIGSHCFDCGNLVTDPSVAERLAGEEYSYRRSEFGGYMLLSRGSDGGMHYRGPAYSAAAARGWCEEHRRSLARRIMSGEIDGTLVFRGHAGPYLG